MKGFRDFLNQGNVVQLAVAFVIGGVYFFFVVPYNRLQARTRSPSPPSRTRAHAPMASLTSQGCPPVLVVHRGGRIPGRIAERP